VSHTQPLSNLKGESCLKFHFGFLLVDPALEGASLSSALRLRRLLFNSSVVHGARSSGFQRLLMADTAIECVMWRIMQNVAVWHKLGTLWKRKTSPPIDKVAALAIERALNRRCRMFVSYPKPYHLLPVCCIPCDFCIVNTSTTHWLSGYLRLSLRVQDGS
jgi:hypothetical protein